MQKIINKKNWLLMETNFKSNFLHSYRSKNARPLPSIPQKNEGPYELKMHYPEESVYLDSDYQTVEEINEGYQHLFDNEDDDSSSYVQPNDVHVNEDATLEDSDKRHSYLKILENPEKMSFTKSECVTVTESAFNECEKKTIGLEKSRPEVILEVFDIDEQKAEIRHRLSDISKKEAVVIHEVSYINKKVAEVSLDVSDVHQPEAEVNRSMSDINQQETVVSHFHRP
jgi:hypothetical protein